MEAPCNPTESAEKVRTAILALFPDAELLEAEGIVSGTSSGLGKLAELLRAQHIRGSAREVLLGAIRDDRLVIHLNKQAALMGRVSFSAQSPLGDIRVTIIADDLREVVDEIAPLPERG